MTIPAGLLASGPALRDQVRAAYLKFGDKVREVLGRDIVLVETDHFLIWTDWRYRERPLLADMLEEMYLSLCEQFDLNPAEDIFLAKCPVFCFQRPGRFRKFAQKFDGYSGKDSIGYTRSVEANGHVHLVLVRQGDTRIDADRFATTLVHEGTHAFVHRLYSPRLIPHWVNEGLADFMAERVLGDRSPTAENADMLARQYVKHGWPIGNLLRGSGPIGIHEYPVAHSLVALLADPVFSGQAGEPDLPLAGVSVSGSSTAFTAFIRSLKDGLDCPAALAANYGGLTPEQLESRWHERYQPAE